MLEKYINGSAAYNYGTAVPYDSPYSQPKTGIREIPKTKTKENSKIFVRLMAFYLSVIFIVAGGIVYSKVRIMQAQTNVENLKEEVSSLAAWLEKRRYIASTSDIESNKKVLMLSSFGI